MTPAISDRKIEANRHNAALSTGPTSDTGKQTSARNSLSHGLTSREALLPGEDPAVFCAYLENYRASFRPLDLQTEELVAELVGLRWRLRRVPVFEAQLISLEVRNLIQSDDEQAKGLDPSQLLALAYMRLCERKVLQNLQNQEARLRRRIDKILIALINAVAVAVPSSHQPTPVTPSSTIPKNEPIRIESNLGRNEQCSCGSGLKFKRCCLNGQQGVPAIKIASAA